MKAEPTRETILAAALRRFSQRGFLGATTRRIAGEAGVAEVTLFRHFGSKEKLFGEVIRVYSGSSLFQVGSLKSSLPLMR